MKKESFFFGILFVGIVVFLIICASGSGKQTVCESDNCSNLRVNESKYCSYHLADYRGTTIEQKAEACP